MHKHVFWMEKGTKWTEYEFKKWAHFCRTHTKTNDRKNKSWGRCLLTAAENIGLVIFKCNWDLKLCILVWHFNYVNSGLPMIWITKYNNSNSKHLLLPRSRRWSSEASIRASAHCNIGLKLLLLRCFRYDMNQTKNFTQQCEELYRPKLLPSLISEGRFFLWFSTRWPTLPYTLHIWHKKINGGKCTTTI